MLRTNLATRPFYNERIVHLLLGVAAALVLVFTLFNALRLINLSSRQAALGGEIARHERQAAELDARAAAVRSGIDPKALERVTLAAAEANAIVDARAFSWTALFNDIEATLPPDVMLTSISPSVDKDLVMRVQFVVLGRSVEGVDAFIERLEQTKHFVRVLASAERVTEDGLYETTIVGTYQPSPRTGREPAAGTADGGTR